MAIATITPPNPTTTNVLAQALSAGMGSLQNALNAAIQRGAQDVANQMRQEQDLIAEQQRNIANERAERIDQRNRAQWLMQFEEQRANNQLQRDITLSDSSLRQAAGERADTLFGFQQQDRATAVDLGVTAPELAARQDRRASVPIEFMQRDRARAEELGVTQPDLALAGQLNVTENQQIARDNAETNRMRANAAATRQQNEQATNARFDLAATEIVGRVNDPAQFEAMTPQDLQASFNILSNSSTTNSPEIEAARVRIQGRLPQQQSGSTTAGLTQEVRRGELQGQLAEIRQQLRAEGISPQERNQLRARAENLTVQLQQLENVLSRRGIGGNTRESSGRSPFYQFTTD